MDRLIYTYALIKSLYDQEEDYIDCFWPFTIKSFSEEDNLLSPKSIQRNIGKKFDLDIPLHVLINIIKRAENQGYLKPKNKWNRYKLTEKGKNYLDQFETDKDVSRRINALFIDITEFYGENGVQISAEEAQKLICSLLHENIKVFIEYVNPSSSFNKDSYFKPKKYEELLIKYIEKIEKQDQTNYETFKDMIFGSLISVIIRVKEPLELSETSKYFNFKVFFDTNFIFSILKLHSSNFSDPAIELFNLLKKHDFQLKIFDFTLNEIRHVLNGYSPNKSRYPSSIRINDIYANLNRKGWEKSDALEFLANIEETLDDKGIEIEETDLDLNNYKLEDENLRTLIKKYRPDQKLHGQNHDLCAIEQIKKIRNKDFMKIEDSKALFLTSDVKLTKFNFIEMGHKDKGTVCEVFLDRFLTNFLWLKYPDAKVSLKSIIESYSRDLFVKKRIWDKFFKVVQDLKEKGKVKEENISLMMYHSNIESTLIELEDEDVDKITDDFVLGNIEEAKKVQEEKIKEEKSRVRKEYDKKISEIESKKEEEITRVQTEKDKQISKVKMEKDKELLNQSKKLLKEGADTEANIYSIIITVAVSILFLYLIYRLYLVFKDWQLDTFFGWFLIILLGGGGFLGLMKYFKSFSKSYISNYIYESKLKGIELDVDEKEEITISK